MYNFVFWKKLRNLTVIRFCNNFIFNMVTAQLKYQLRKIQADYQAKKLLYSFKKEWFENKRVAIVGGADSVLNQKSGEFIDSFDVVVRINKGVELIKEQSEYIGKRTDILFHSFLDDPRKLGWSPITVNLWKKHGVKHIVYSKNHKSVKQGIYDVLLFAKKSNGEMQFTEIPEELYHKNMEVLKPCWPTTGFTAINTIFNCQPKELFVTGITFFKTSHNKVYRPENIEDFKRSFEDKPKFHHPDKEFEHFKKLYLQHPEIVKTDPTLSKILAEQ